MSSDLLPPEPEPEKTKRGRGPGRPRRRNYVTELAELQGRVKQAVFLLRKSTGGDVLVGIAIATLLGEE